MREAGGLCIIDEIQTGFGRAGEYFWIFETQGKIIIMQECPVCTCISMNSLYMYVYVLVSLGLFDESNL